MATPDVKESISNWIAGHKDLQADFEENDSKVKLTHEKKCLTLNIQNEDIKEWFIWSDDPISAHIQDIQDFISSEKPKTPTDVLDFILKTLNKDLIYQRTQSNSDDEFVDAEDNDDDDDDEGDDDNYYNNLDNDSEEEKEKSEEEEEGGESLFNAHGGNSAAIKRLMKDFKNMNSHGDSFGITGQPRGNNLFIWDVQLLDVPVESKLGKDVKEYAAKYKRPESIQLEMHFPDDYPMSPPFVRVLRPRFKFLTGHVTIGGSICMEMLTKSGWSPANDIETILIQIRSEILEDKNAQLDNGQPDRAYGELEAKDAFARMVQRYGWNK